VVPPRRAEGNPRLASPRPVNIKIRMADDNVDDRSRGFRARLGSMSLTRMQSVDKAVGGTCPIPDIPKGGARIKVAYAGACYRTRYLNNRNDFRVHAPGYEISGVVESLDAGIDKNRCRICVGDHVVVYPFEREGNSLFADGGYPEYIAVPELKYLIKVPNSLSMSVAAMLPCGGLRAYNAICRTAPKIEHLLNTGSGSCTLLIVSAGGLGLWALQCAKHLFGENKNLRVVITDNNSEKLFHALDEGADDVVHWAESEHEGYLYERTLDVCHDGVDAAIDFVSSPRTLKRVLSVLNFEGLCVVAGNSGHEAQVSLQTLAINEQSLIGTQRGSVEMLEHLISLVAEKKILAPSYSIFPVSEADQVFRKVSQAQIKGRAILQICPELQEIRQSSD